MVPHIINNTQILSSNLIAYTVNQKSATAQHCKSPYIMQALHTFMKFYLMFTVVLTGLYDFRILNFVHSCLIFCLCRHFLYFPEELWTDMLQFFFFRCELLMSVVKEQMILVAGRDRFMFKDESEFYLQCKLLAAALKHWGKAFYNRLFMRVFHHTLMFTRADFLFFFLARNSRVRQVLAMILMTVLFHSGQTEWMCCSSAFFLTG